jgi:TonB-dependent SusC/RagA subfamily outer membrane receptor
MVKGMPETRVETDKDGKFSIEASAGQQLNIVSVDKGMTTVKAEGKSLVKVVLNYAGQSIDVGAGRTFTRSESTAAVSTIYNEDFNNRSAKNVSNSLLGQGMGMMVLQNSGNYADVEPTFYVRGLQSLSSSSPLILVDGLERDMSLLSPEEVESVSVLKDAAAVALYGYKGINGAILITTKRGKYNSKEVYYYPYMG